MTRTILTAPLTLHANDFPSLQSAINFATREFDFAGQDIIVQCAASTYEENIEVYGANVGGGRLIIRGEIDENGRPETHLTSNNSKDTFWSRDGNFVYLERLKVSSRGGPGANCLRMSYHGTIFLGDVFEYGHADWNHNAIGGGGNLYALAHNVLISGGANMHWNNGTNAVVSVQGGSVYTLLDEPVFNEFAHCGRGSALQLGGIEFVGPAKGKKFSLVAGGLIQTNGAGLDHLPGDQAGYNDGTGVYDDELGARGVWTPSIGFASPGDATIEYGSRTGVWRKIGHLVFFDMSVQFRIIPGAVQSAGRLEVMGLPFGADATVGSFEVRNLTSGVVWPAGVTNVSAAITAAGETKLRLGGVGPGVGYSLLGAANFPTNVWHTLGVSGTYQS